MDSPITNRPEDMKVRNENNNPSFEYLREDAKNYKESIGKEPFTSRKKAKVGISVRT